MAAAPTLAVIELSESFRAAWSDLADELAIEHVRVGPDEPPAPGTFAIVLAAGGEEDRGLDMLRSVRRPDGSPVYLVGARPSHRFAVEAVRRGADDYFALPGDLDLLRRTIGARAEVARERRRSSGAGRAVADPFDTLLGASDALTAALDEARRVAPHGAVTVLIQGETGTGKELLAHALHDASPRAGSRFLAVNCAAIPSELMESELFGHERGAFTDAHAAKPGLFEEANGGTLFLDEIGHLPLPLQGKLLRAVEEGRIRRVGATQTREVDVRIIVASHVDLAEAVRRGEFREDLYYRLNVITLRLPGLRERGDDVELLASAFATSLAARYKLPVPGLTPEVKTALRRHPWPGNVRELRHAIERALLLSAPGTLDPRHLIPKIVPGATTTTGGIPFPATLDEIQAAAARTTLERNQGNKSAAARQLGVSRARLQRLLDRTDGDEA